MPDSSHSDAEIIQTAYADRVTEAFKVFAEGLGSGQSEQSCVMRFHRALEMVRRARDLALQTAAGPAMAEAGSEELRRVAGKEASEPLSAEDQALIEQALAGTTGHMPAAPTQRYRR